MNETRKICPRCGTDHNFCGSDSRLAKESRPITSDERITQKLDRVMQLMGHLVEWRKQHPDVQFPIKKQQVLDAADLRRQADVEKQLKLTLIARNPALLDALSYEDLGNI